jgi:hypothetical protein
LGVKFTLEIVIVNVSDQILFKESQNIQRFWIDHKNTIIFILNSTHRNKKGIKDRLNELNKVFCLIKDGNFINVFNIIKKFK